MTLLFQARLRRRGDAGCLEEEEALTESEPADLVWRKSTASGGGNCVEVAFTEDAVHVRTSRQPSGPSLSFTISEWSAFLTGARNGEFDT
jgi:hypothetical protein